MDRRRFLPTYHYEDNTTGLLEDSVGKPLRDYKIYGNSLQNGTPTPETPVEIESVGDKTANLFDINQIDSVVLSNGGKITNNGDGSLIVDGTYTVNCQKTLSQLAPSLKVGDVVVFNAESDAYRDGSGKLNIIYLVDGTTIEFKKPITITQSHLDSKVIFYSRMMADGVEPSCYKNIQLEYGDTATAYEPFGYKIPIKTIGKNLFDENILNDFTTEPTNDDEWVIKNFAGIINNTIDFKENTRYTLVFTAKQTAGNPRLIFKYTDGSSNNIGTWQLSKEYTAYVGTSAANKTIAYIGMEYGSTGFVYILKGSMQLAEGVYNASTMPEYEPYVEPVTTNIYLTEPLRKVDEYTDYIDFSNGCVVRNVRCLSLDGSDDETIILQSTNSYGISNFYLDGLSDMALSEDCVMCNRLSRQTTNVANTMTEGFRFVITTSTYPYMRISSERVSTVADFRAWLSDNVVSFAYATNAPIIEPLELPPIPTIKGTTTVTADTAVRPSEVMWQYYRR